jgi:hypothetical protein
MEPFEMQGNRTKRPSSEHTDPPSRKRTATQPSSIKSNKSTQNTRTHSPILDNSSTEPSIREILLSNKSLPDLDEIEATGKLLFQQGNTRILLLPNQNVVKYGPGVRVEEALNLHFVNQYTDVSAPRLCGVCVQDGRILDKDGDTGENAYQTCIFMTHISGNPLSELLPEMDEPTLSQIVSEISDQVKKLRDLPDHGYIGSVYRGVCLDPIFRSGKTGGPGPFTSEKAMTEFLLKNRPGQSLPIEHHLRNYMNSETHNIVFTHGDLAPRNILVRDGHLSGIVDWQMAGWYPEYWESVKLLSTLPRDGAWFRHIEKIVSLNYCRWLLYLRLRD